VPYFNAGVLRMSLARLRDEKLAEKSIEILGDRRRLAFQDQDVLNLLFRDRHDVLPQTFNVFDAYTRHTMSTWEALKDPAIVHFAGSGKPWHSDMRTKFAKEWRMLHADVLGLRGSDRSEYISSRTSIWQEHVHAALVKARYSRVGVKARSALPVRVKHGLNQLALAVTPRRSKLNRQIEYALQYGHDIEVVTGSTKSAPSTEVV
jgi:lipopolysaccharide biosynthesis glycosyltransferase